MEVTSLLLELAKMLETEKIMSDGSGSEDSGGCPTLSLISPLRPPEAARRLTVEGLLWLLTGLEHRGARSI